MTRSPLAIVAVSLACVFLAVLVGVVAWVAVNEPRRVPFDAEFTLVDDRGGPVDQSMFRRAPAILYFGYTRCPEVCPTTLFEVADWLNALGPEGQDLKAYFFSVDPERDTPEIMRGYVTAFTDRITGITGKPEEMKKVVDGWIVYAEKVPSENGDYHMSHTMSLLLVGADGRLKGLIPYGTHRDVALKSIKDLLL
ncbi:SCO family protein [Ensifer adhaerens]|uniref:SCO family protein n=1 Tax=Ensifer adhaerens TaxID=106592 RepID=UPI003D008132